MVTVSVPFLGDTDLFWASVLIGLVAGLTAIVWLRVGIEIAKLQTNRGLRNALKEDKKIVTSVIDSSFQLVRVPGTELDEIISPQPLGDNNGAEKLLESDPTTPRQPLQN